jgi:capsular exopolysaccharide synthesis family protein
VHEPAFDWREFFFRLLRQWYWIALSLLLALALAWVYLRYAVPLYQVSSTILIQSDKNQRTVTESYIAEKLGLETNFEIEDEIQVFKSRSLMRRVVDSLRLHVQYFSEGRVKTSEIYPTLEQPLAVSLRYAAPERQAYGVSLRIEPVAGQPEAFACSLVEGDTVHARFGEPFTLGAVTYCLDLNDTLFHRSALPHIIRLSNPESVAQGYAANVSVQQVGQSNVLALSLASPVPEKAIATLNALMDAYAQSVIEDKNKVGLQTLRFIDERLRFVAEELYGVEKAVESFKSARNLPVDLPVQAQRFLSEIAEQDRALAELDLRERLLDSIALFFRTDSALWQPLPVASEIISGELAAQVRQYNESVLRRRLLLENATLENPAARNAFRQLGDLRQNILLSVSNLKRETAERRQQLQQRLQPFERQMALMPRNQRELLQIMRQQQIKENLFLFLLQRREETALSVAAQVSNSRVIDRAANVGLIAPKRFQTFLFAAFAGLLLPVVFFYLRTLWRNTVDTEADLEQITSLPFLGSIAADRKSRKTPIVVQPNSRSAIAEMFRLLRTNLQFVLGDEPAPVVLITSGVSGEGKTFLSANLSVAMALSGKKTVVVGLDLRKPKLTQYFGESKDAKGLTHFLIGQATPKELILPTPASENLFYVPAGPLPPNPAELILNGKLGPFFQHLRAHFDCILVDTAPLGLVTDALLLMPYVSATICVARAGKTNKNLIRLIDQLHRDGKLKRPALVLNGVKKGKGYGYGYGYGYYQD